MEKHSRELYEYARKKLNQKKRLHFHFVIYLTASLFMFAANILFKFGHPSIWCAWVITIWFSLIIIHFTKVYIFDRFMNKEWEIEQIEKMVEKQQNKITQFEAKTIENTPQKTTP